MKKMSIAIENNRGRSNRVVEFQIAIVLSFFCHLVLGSYNEANEEYISSLNTCQLVSDLGVFCLCDFRFDKI